jgi:hypothetical protein
MKRQLMWILWPAFLIASAADGLIFSLFDPQDMHIFGEPVNLGPRAIYTIGFFLFWAFAAASSALTCLLQRSPFEVNRCPLPELERPEDCPKSGQRGGRA